MSTVDLELQALLIGGEWTPASGGATFERVDPYTGEAVTVAAAARAEDARARLRRRGRGLRRVGGDAAGPPARAPQRGLRAAARARRRDSRAR